jgi:DNA-binding NtrC family response regulator
MNTTQAAVLVVDDDREMASVLCDVLRDAGYRAQMANSGVAALSIVAQEEPDLLVSDLRMSGMDGHQLQAELKRLAPNLPVVIITAFGSIATAIESMKLGAFDRLRGELARTYGVSDIIAANPRIVAALEMIQQVADSPASVLITGESGTGKELFARALHFASSRRDGPLVPINCAAIPENLIESEMFGYVKGAFTDARNGKIGLFQAARGGTLFLDEIGDMPLALQAKMLRVLEDKRVRPLGATVETPIDVRIVAATNADLEQAIAQGKFRSDLYYRLATIAVHVPPLRERPEDLPLLIKHFLVRAAIECGKPLPAIEPDAAECLARYGWPGNVRELQNVIQSAVILCREKKIAIGDLPPRLAASSPVNTNFMSEAAARRASLDDVEREYIRQIVASVAGNKTEAAAILQIDRKTLYRKLGEIEATTTPEVTAVTTDKPNT